MVVKAGYSKILVALDGSGNADMAFEHALASAGCHGSMMVLVNCFGDIPSAIGGEARAKVLADCEAKSATILAPFVEKCKAAGITCKTVIRQGHAGRTIVQICEDEHCDLIVMGSRGLSEFEDIVLGSVSMRVLRHAHVPILVVR